MHRFRCLNANKYGDKYGEVCLDANFRAPFLLGKQLWTRERRGKRGLCCFCWNSGDAALCSFMMQTNTNIYCMRERVPSAISFFSITFCPNQYYFIIYSTFLILREILTNVTK